MSAEADSGAPKGSAKAKKYRRLPTSFLARTMKEPENGYLLQVSKQLQLTA